MINYVAPPRHFGLTSPRHSEIVPPGHSGLDPESPKGQEKNTVTLNKKIVTLNLFQGLHDGRVVIPNLFRDLLRVGDGGSSPA
ncbi:hypothetical protein THIOSC15_2530016 [uncultured Thiomicrorhabdus sp.]